MNSLPKIGTLWIGGKLPDIERLCISSMAGNGHEVTLYTYSDVCAPKGVIVEDASFIIPKKDVFTYKKTGSYATFADWFRLRMIAMTGKVWLDADVALLKPFNPADEYFFVGGTHKSFGHSVNNYAIKMPANSDICKDALSYFDSPMKFLRYMAWHRSVRISANRAITGSWDLSKFRWGVFGMGVLTDLVKKHRLDNYVHYNGEKIVEGVSSIISPMDSKSLSSVEIAHFFSSCLANKDIYSFRSGQSSIYERLNNLYS
ncbi:hypothetical protein E4191_15990 (plasmid) [Paracoccus liaowanqingii]|uniref:Alpha 1,4-glycosyltransferase domain-containing protein n=1 Tax=Paracoccus liaowanqingii TaxID=2560053 RepID=A0A4Y5SS98_9RHOB|nr:hypothetical protein [Paracoccus liaowanqingii]QDA35675.1 hypothetical protein E4191_15990 [Paracoccus liaowanqingii]